jgi:hypothetical protein
MYTQKNITNSRFTVRFCTVARYLGFKKVGPSHVRVSRLLKEIDDFRDNPNDYDFFASRPGDLYY